MIGVILSRVASAGRQLLCHDTVCRCFASLARSDLSSVRAGHASRRLDIVQVDHDERKRGTMRLYTLHDRVAAASVLDLGSWDHKDFRLQGGSLSSLKGVTGLFLSVEAVKKSTRKRILIFDPITKKTFYFHKPSPPKISRWAERTDEQMYIGQCYLQSSPSGAAALFKVVELCSIVDDSQEGRAVGCDICTLDNGGGRDGRYKRIEWRSVAAGAADLPLRQQKVSLDDCFHGDNLLCWGVCQDENDSWSIRGWAYENKILEERYLRNPSLEPKIPARVGSALVSVLSLDLVTETVKSTALPSSLLQRPNSCNMHMCNLDGRPSICLLPKVHSGTGNLEVWMLKKCSGVPVIEDMNSWFLRCSIPAKRLPGGHLSPVSLWCDKLFLLHEWADDCSFDSTGRAQRRLVYYDICSDELIRVEGDGGEDIVMDARSDVLMYNETFEPIWTGDSVQGMAEEVFIGRAVPTFTQLQTI